MQNFKQTRRGFRFEHEISTEGNKRKLVVLDISYLAGSRNKGVLATVRNIEEEQCDGYKCETSTLFGDGNCSEWIEILARKSDKKVLQAVEGMDKSAPLIVAAFIEDSTKGRMALQQAIQNYRSGGVA